MVSIKMFNFYYLEVASRTQIRLKSPANKQRDFASNFIFMCSAKRRSGLEAERTHRGWKATPTSE